MSARAASVLVALVLGCSSPVAPVDAGLPDALEHPDAEPVDASLADAGTAEDATVRRLIQRRLFRDLPIDNRFHDPLFDLSIFAWSAFPATAAGRPELLTVERPGGPVDAPLLRVDKHGPGGTTVTGRILGSHLPLDISVWVGVPESAAVSLGLSLPVTDGQGLMRAVELSPAPGPATVVDGVAFRRWEAHLGAPTAGWVTLILTDPGEQPTYLMAPTAMISPRAQGTRPAPSRSLTALERRTLALLSARELNRLRSADQP